MAAHDFDDSYIIDGNPAPRRRMWPWFIVVVLLCGIATWYFFGDKVMPRHNTTGDIGAKTATRGKDGKPPQQIPVVSAAPVVKHDVPVYLNGLGTVQASNIVTVHSRVDGELIDAPFAEGQDIKKGSILGHIDPRLFKSAYDQALANQAKDQALLENARLDLQRYGALGNTISAQALNTQSSTVKQLEAQVRADKAAADNAKTQLSYTTITAPIDGRTGIRQVDVGNIIHAGDTEGLVVITQVEPINVLFSLPQQNLPAINKEIMAQGALQVTALDQDNKTVLDHGKLNLVDNQIDQTTGTVRLQAEFPNHMRQLWPGGFTNVQLLLQILPNQLTIPTVAVQRGPQGAYVFVLQQDQTVALRQIETGAVTGDDVVIAKGLTEGEQVITDGTSKLQDKAKVKIADAPKQHTSDKADQVDMKQSQ